MLIFWLITLAAFIGNTVLGMLVLARNKKSSTNLLFAILAFSAALWSVTNFASLQVTSPDTALFLTRLVMFFVVGQTTSFFLLMHSFPGPTINISPFKKYIYIIFSVGVLLVTISPFLFTDLDLTRPLPPPVPIPGVGMAVFVLHALISVLGGINRLIRQYKKAQGLVKVQWHSILLATILLFTLVPLTNFVAVVVFGFSDLIFLSPIYTLIFVSLIYYAIVRNKLLDIRFVIARSMAYLLSITVLGSVYGFAMFGLIDQAFPDTRMDIMQQSFYILGAIILAFTFQPLKRFFDKMTDRIFYRDRYSTEEVLNNLGKVFITKSNNFELLDDSLGIITNALKVEFGRLVVLGDTEIYKTEHIGKYEHIEIDYKHLKMFERQVTILDKASVEEKEALRKINTHALLRLTTQDGLVGYLLLGDKLSGTIYTQQDVNLLELLSQELAVAIQNAKSYQEIQAFSETMEREVLDATAKLRETNQRLQKLDQAKDEFISMASHQLRTPLTTIKGYLSMLLEGDAGEVPDKQKEFIDLAFVSSQRMAHLISDMLNVSRVNTGKLTIDRENIDLVEVVESEVEQLKRQADMRNVKLNFHKPKHPLPPVYLDEGKMRQVIMNFTDNAIYYAPDGEVDVYIEQKDKTIEFRVVDNGIGVPEEGKKQLFSKFFRAENARFIRPDGTGLGLYMAKQVIEAQNGELVFESEKGKGSTFGFRFNLEDKKVNKQADA